MTNSIFGVGSLNSKDFCLLARSSFYLSCSGEVLMWKVGGAKAALGGSLDEVIAAAQKAIDDCRSIGVGLTPCTIPAVGKPNFQIEPGKMEVGIGHHGEPGVAVTDLKSADEKRAWCRLRFHSSPSANGRCCRTRKRIDARKAGAIANRPRSQNLLAKIGRASRLGERSRGTLDAGATSCALILKTFARVLSGAQ